VTARYTPSDYATVPFLDSDTEWYTSYIYIFRPAGDKHIQEWGSFFDELLYNCNTSLV